MKHPRDITAFAAADNVTVVVPVAVCAPVCKYHNSTLTFVLLVTVAYRMKIPSVVATTLLTVCEEALRMATATTQKAPRSWFLLLNVPDVALVILPDKAEIPQAVGESLTTPLVDTRSAKTQYCVIRTSSP